MALFTRYFDNLYNPTTNTDRNFLRDYEGGRGENEEDNIISVAEMEEVLKGMRNRIAAGICEIPPELLKFGGVEVAIYH